MTPSPPPPSALATVLVVSAVPYLRLWLSAQLRRQGYHVGEAAALAEAVRFCAQAAPQAIVLHGAALSDQGRAALRVLRPAAPTVPIVVVLAQATQADVLDIAAGGARDVLLTPVAPARLAQAVQTLIAPPQVRQHARQVVQLPAQLGFGARPGTPYPGVIEDLSLSGLRCRWTSQEGAAAPRVGVVAQVRVSVSGTAELLLFGRVVRVIGPDCVALAFLHLREDAAAHISTFCQQSASDTARAA